MFELKLADEEDIELILNGQKSAFHDSMLRYQDFDINPYFINKEELTNRILAKSYYNIFYDNEFCGAVYIIHNPDKFHLKIHTLFVIPEFQNKGIGQKAIEKLEEINSETIEWSLESPSDLDRNSHVYEKMGYLKTGEYLKINDKLSLTCYKKSKLSSFSRL